MNLPSVIIGIILSALAVGIGAIYYGDAFTDGAASATAATLASQGGQISDAVDTFRAQNAGQEPADMTALIDGNYLESIPSVAISGTNEWNLSTVNGEDNKPTLALEGDASTVCEEAQNAAGHDTPATFATDTSSVGNELYGCAGADNSNLTFYRQ